MARSQAKLEPANLIRTIKAYSLPLNTGKWQTVQRLVAAYAAEKDDHLAALGDDRLLAACSQHEQYRDGLLGAGYASPHGLPGRMWKLALQDAYETVQRGWAALALELRARVTAQAAWTSGQKHYANWLLEEPRRLAQLAGGLAPVAAHIQVAYPQRKGVQNYLRRQVRKRRGQRARVRVARSLALDSDMYSLFEQNGRQYLSLMTLQPRERLVIPLTGQQVMGRTVRVVLDVVRQQVVVHYTAQVDLPQPLTGERAGLDAGLSEVYTDEQGQRYGTAFGDLLIQHSDRICDKGRQRNKLYQLEQKYLRQGKRRKASHIRRFNLGHKKQNQQRRRNQAEVARQVNTALNQVLDKRQPSVMVTEKLDLRGPAPSKSVSRRVSLWARRTLNERSSFKASSRGSRRQHVTPAYSSQSCPQCGYLEARNRAGDSFQCRYCGHRDRSDRVAALNLKARLDDPDITLYTPKARVKAILTDRFSARLPEAQGDQSRSVAGRTPGTKRKPRQPESETTGVKPS